MVATTTMMLPPLGPPATHRGAVGIDGQQFVLQRAPDRHPVDAQLRARAVVDVGQHADRVAAHRLVEHARRGPDAALEPEAMHPRAGADAAARERAVLGLVERAHDVGGEHVPPLNVVEPLIVALRDDR